MQLMVMNPSTGVVLMAARTSSWNAHTEGFESKPASQFPPEPLSWPGGSARQINGSPKRNRDTLWKLTLGYGKSACLKGT